MRFILVVTVRGAGVVKRPFIHSDDYTS